MRSFLFFLILIYLVCLFIYSYKCLDKKKARIYMCIIIYLVVYIYVSKRNVYFTYIILFSFYYNIRLKF